MSRYQGDQSKFGFSYESGTYGTASGAAQWPGIVQNSDVIDEVNSMSSRYVGGNTRDVEIHFNTVQDSTLNFSTWVQDWRMLGFALGSMVTTGSPTYSHALTAVNSDSSNGFTSGTSAPFVSFSAQASKNFNPTGLNFNKTINGCIVNTLSIDWVEKQPVVMTVNAVGQSTTYSSGASYAPTANTERPYLTSDMVMGIPSGTPVRFLKKATFNISQNVTANHYVNGSTVVELPYPGNRDYGLDITVDSSTEQEKTFYDSYFIAGSTFNAHIRTAKSSTRACDIFLSGCKISKMTDPLSFEGAQESTLTIVPSTVNAVVVDTGLVTYGAW